MTTPISSLAVSPETARVIQAQMAVATGRPALLMGVIVAAVVSAVFTVVVLGIVGVMVRGAFETGNLLLLAGAGLLLILAIPYFVLFQTLRVFRAPTARAAGQRERRGLHGLVCCPGSLDPAYRVPARQSEQAFNGGVHLRRVPIDCLASKKLSQDRSEDATDAVLSQFVSKKRIGVCDPFPRLPGSTAVLHSELEALVFRQVWTEGFLLMSPPIHRIGLLESQLQNFGGCAGFRGEAGPGSNRIAGDNVRSFDDEYRLTWCSRSDTRGVIVVGSSGLGGHAISRLDAAQGG